MRSHKRKAKSVRKSQEADYLYDERTNFAVGPEPPNELLLYLIITGLSACLLYVLPKLIEKYIIPRFL